MSELKEVLGDGRMDLSSEEAELRELITQLDLKTKKEKIRIYRPFGEDDKHFDDSNTQQDFHNCDTLNRWVFAGNRGGKTACGAAEALCFAMGEDGQDYYRHFPSEAKDRYKTIQTPNEGWVVSRTHDVQIEAAQKWLMRLIPDDMLESVKKKSGDIIDYMVMSNGSKIKFKSSEQGREAFQGAEKRWIWFDEEPVSEGVYNECLMRQSGRFPLAIWGTLTPVKGLTFVYDNIWKQRDGRKDLDCFRWTLYDNPYIDKELIEQLEESLSKAEQETRLMGKFRESSGLIYPMFKREKHLKDPFMIQDEWRIVESIDLGYNNPTAVLWVAVNPVGVFYVCGEFYQRGLQLHEFGELLPDIRKDTPWYTAKRQRPWLTLIDPSACRTKDDGSMSSRERLAKDFDIYTKPADNEVHDGISKVRDRLRPGKKGPRLLIFRSCVNFINEIEKYRFQEYKSEAVRHRKNKKEDPRKKDDHLMDCIRYIVNEDIRYVSRGKSTGYYVEPSQRNSKTGY